MLIHYLRSAAQALLKHRKHSILNIIGFSLALSVVILIGMHVTRELTTNMYHRNSDRIYKISGWGCPYALCGVIKDGVPEIEAAANVKGKKGQVSVTIDGNTEPIEGHEGMLMVDSAFFSIFDFPVVAGGFDTPIPTTSSVALSQTMARALFDDEDPIGKSVTIDGGYYVVSSVLADAPVNSSIRFSVILLNNPGMTFYDGSTLAQNWSSWNYEIYALVPKGIDTEALDAKIQDVVTRNGNLRYEVDRVRLYPLSDVYFNYADLYTAFKGGNYGQVEAMLWVAILILLLAIVNFFNLSTASGMTRSKEIGLRKVNGATRPSLVVQFLLEAIIITFVATIIALVIANLALPFFSAMVAVEYPLILMNEWWHWGMLIGITLVIGTISGSYPAFYITRVDPINALYTGRVRSGIGMLFMRKALITFQLTASIWLLICTFIITSQLNHLQTKDLGFDKEQIMLLSMDNEIYKQRQSFFSELSALPFVSGITLTQAIVGNADSGGDLKAQYHGEEIKIWSKFLVIDTAFFSTFGIDMVQGRVPRSNEQGSVVLNQAAMAALGVDDCTQVEIADEENTPLGKIPKMVKVTGVCRDFNFKPLKHGVEPLAIYMYDIPAGLINVRVDVGSLSDVDAMLDGLKGIYSKFNSTITPEVRFLNETLDQLYVSEQRFMLIFSVFSTFAILISCFGLLGLIIFSNARRRKEIGVRRVNGSTVFEVVNLLTRSYLGYVAIAFVVATPLAYYVMSGWLAGYVYRVEINWLLFPLAGALALTVVVLTVGLQSWRAASVNPVKSLKSE